VQTSYSIQTKSIIAWFVEAGEKSSVSQPIDGYKSQHLLPDIVQFLGISAPMEALAAGPAAQTDKKSILDRGDRSVAVFAAQGGLDKLQLFFFQKAKGHTSYPHLFGFLQTGNWLPQTSH
jgi:hypothetical protein